MATIGSPHTLESRELPVPLMGKLNSAMTPDGSRPGEIMVRRLATSVGHNLTSCLPKRSLLGELGARFQVGSTADLPINPCIKTPGQPSRISVETRPRARLETRGPGDRECADPGSQWTSSLHSPAHHGCLPTPGERTSLWRGSGIDNLPARLSQELVTGLLTAPKLTAPQIRTATIRTRLSPRVPYRDHADDGRQRCRK